MKDKFRNKNRCDGYITNFCLKRSTQIGKLIVKRIIFDNFVSMKYGDALFALKRALDRRFPGGYNYTHELARILEMHPKTVGRKVRGETQFSFVEILKIANVLDISLDNLFNSEKGISKQQLEMYFYDFSKELDELKKQHINALAFAQQSANSKYLVSTNTLPDVVNSVYEPIALFYYLKWLYFNKGPKSLFKLSEAVIPAKEKQIHREYSKHIMSLKYSVYLFHIDMMKHIADEVLFFFRLNYLTREDVRMLVKTYYQLLERMEEICEKGKLPENGKEISIFYSEILIPNDLAIVESSNIEFAIIYAYFLNPIVSKNRETFKMIREWFRAWLSSANIISISGHQHRNNFFAKQRAALQDVLTNI